MNRQLTYGREQIVKFAKKAVCEKTEVSILDIGAGYGTDLANVKNALQKTAKVYLYGIEGYEPNIQELKTLGVNVCKIDIERDVFPYKDQSFDIVIANQVLEHVKEIFWIISEISRILKWGGYSLWVFRI